MLLEETSHSQSMPTGELSAAPNAVTYLGTILKPDYQIDQEASMA
jgi:hypothetical protein